MFISFCGTLTREGTICVAGDTEFDLDVVEGVEPAVCVPLVLVGQPDAGDDLVELLGCSIRMPYAHMV